MSAEARLLRQSLKPLPLPSQMLQDVSEMRRVDVQLSSVKYHLLLCVASITAVRVGFERSSAAFWTILWGYVFSEGSASDRRKA